MCSEEVDVLKCHLGIELCGIGQGQALDDVVVNTLESVKAKRVAVVLTELDTQAGVSS